MAQVRDKKPARPAPRAPTRASVEPRPRSPIPEAAAPSGPSPRAARSHDVHRAAHGPHDEQAKAKIVARLRSVEGHLRGVLAMVESDAYCIDVLHQTKAIQAALGRVDGLLLERHLSHCASTAIRSEDASARERVIAELLDVFDATRRG